MSEPVKKAEIIQGSSSLPLDKSALKEMKKKRELLREYVSSQLVKRVDYGVIPGTDKPTLLKPGAEKLKMLFNLQVFVEVSRREFDLHANFASYTAKARVFHIPTNNFIAECEGTCNSQEKKYRERNVYEWIKHEDGTKTKELVATEPTHIGDLDNTLNKMAQKRAFVGAIIAATGASDFFLQDVDDSKDAENLGIKKEAEAPSPGAPGVTNATSKVKHSHDRRDESKPYCELCNTEMRESKFDNSLYCPNYKDKSNGEHTKIQLSGGK